MFSTLSTRMFLLAAAVTLLGLGLLAVIMVRMHSDDLENEVIQGALRLSDTIARSTRYSMLQNRKEDVYEIVSTVGAQPGIERIRLFNKEGLVTFSTVSGERGSTVDKAEEACTHCHGAGGEGPMADLRGEQLTRIFRAEDGHRVLGLIEPIYSEPACSAANCHPSPEVQSILGVLDVQTSLAGIDAVVQSQNRRFLLLTYCFMLVIASACGLFIWIFVHRPVRRLIRGTRSLAAGDLDHRIRIRSRSEIGLLADSFNQMAEELKQARIELTDWTRTLEQRVAEKTKTLQQAQSKLLQSEKLASLGSLSAVVAHEINNPLSGVLTYTKLVRKKLGAPLAPEVVRALQEYLAAMESEIVRCGKIVSNLLAFSRHSDMAVSEASVNTLIEKILFLISHKLELQEIALAKALDPNLPPIACDADRIQQALLAVLINAVEAMPDGGTLHIRSRTFVEEETRHRWVEVVVEDTGYGIPDDVMPHLFEPFYTTKENKKGVGLGLSVVYGIVKRHGGRIDVKSEVGRGTVFTLTLPERAEIEQDLLEREESEPALAAPREK